MFTQWDESCRTRPNPVQRILQNGVVIPIRVRRTGTCQQQRQQFLDHSRQLVDDGHRRCAGSARQRVQVDHEHLLTCRDERFAAVPVLQRDEDHVRLHDAITAARGPRLDGHLHPAGRWIFLAVLIGALGYAGASILTDTAEVGETLATGVFLFLGLALANEFVWRMMSETSWVYFKTFGLPLILFVFLIANAGLYRAHAVESEKDDEQG